MVFVVKKKDARDQAFDVITTLGLQKRQTKGVVGLEIEVEGRKLPREEVAEGKYWTFHTDGSLRGEENGEYVLRSPIGFDQVDDALGVLWDWFGKRKSELDDSNRTSVHVHLNVQTFHLNRLTAFMAMYFILEEILTEWCGEHRVGNLFCLRAKDAPAIISQTRRFIKADMQAQMREHHHYAGLNANALHKFGSLEFRPLRGVSDPEIIKQWVGILQRLYELSAEYEDPRTLINTFSSTGPFEFYDRLLGEYGVVVRKALSMDDEAIRQSMYEGVRLAQDLCYARDWSKFQGINLRSDPFGRNPRVVMQKVLNAMQPQPPQPQPVYHDGPEAPDDWEPDDMEDMD